MRGRPTRWHRCRARRRSVRPNHWSPDGARQFLALHEGDRLWPAWAFLLGSGVRIGELVFLAWSNVDLEKRLVPVNEFVTVLGYEVQRSSGKSREAIRTIDLDRHLVDVDSPAAGSRRLASAAGSLRVAVDVLCDAWPIPRWTPQRTKR